MFLYIYDADDADDADEEGLWKWSHTSRLPQAAAAGVIPTILLRHLVLEIEILDAFAFIEAFRSRFVVLHLVLVTSRTVRTVRLVTSTVRTLDWLLYVRR